MEEREGGRRGRDRRKGRKEEREGRKERERGRGGERKKGILFLLPGFMGTLRKSEETVSETCIYLVMQQWKNGIL